MNSLHTLNSFQASQYDITFHFENGRYVLQPLSVNRFRFTAYFHDNDVLSYQEPQAEQEFASNTILKWRKELQQSTASDPQITLPFDNVQIVLNLDPFYLSVIENQKVIYQDLPRRAYLKDNNSRHWHYHQRLDEDKYYGLGEKTGRLERSGRRYKMNNVDAVGYNPESGDPLYKHIPFFVRYRPSQNRCVGVYYHTATHCEFDIGSERSGYWGEFGSFCVDDGPLDCVIMLGTSPQAILDHYLSITGLPVLPTKASLGYLGSTMYYTELEQGSDDAIVGFIDECAYQNIPVSGFHLSSGYTKGHDGLRYTFHWNNQSFSEPAQFVAQMTQRAQVLSPNVKPGLLTTHPLYNEFDAIGAFIREQDGSQSKIEKFWGGDASFVDFTNPQARALWSQHLKSSLIDHGITSIWNDNNEFEMDGEGLCHGDSTPTKASQLRPVISNLMAQTAYEAVAQYSEKRPFILSRAGFSGIQRFAQTWSGDNDSSWRCFRFNIATMLGMSWSGVAFNGMDVGGFTGPAPTPELFLRWVQNGIFHPRFCIHSVNNDNTVTEPWIYPEILPQIQQAFHFRYRLLPTLYSRAERCHRLGLPMVSALSYTDISDSNSAFEDTSFLLADSLLCVAITEPNITELNQYFPRGEWLDWYSGESYCGGQSHCIHVHWDHSPLFIKQGSGVFLDNQYAKSPAAELQIYLAASISGQAHFYDDDGESFAYKSGEFKRTQVDWVTNAASSKVTVTQQGHYVPRYDTIKLSLKVQEQCPVGVSLNNRALSQVLYERKLDHDLWFFDVQTNTVHILLPRSFWESDSHIELLFDQGVQISQEG